MSCNPKQATGHVWKWEGADVACACGAIIENGFYARLRTIKKNWGGDEAYAHKLAFTGYGPNRLNLRPQVNPRLSNSQLTKPIVDERDFSNLKVPTELLKAHKANNIGTIECTCHSLLNGHDLTCSWGKK